MDNDRYRIFCFVLACARFSLDNLATRSLEHTFHTRLCTSSNGDNNVSCEYVYVYLRVCACVPCVYIYIYMPGNMRIVPSEWIIDASATFCVYTRHGERRKTKQKKKKKKNAKNKWTRSVWWLQSCIKINRRRFVLNDFVLVDSACDVSSFFLFFCFFF